MPEGRQPAIGVTVDGNGELRCDGQPMYCFRSCQRVCSSSCVACVVVYNRNDAGIWEKVRVKFMCLPNILEVNVIQ